MAILESGCSFPDCTYQARDEGSGPNLRPPYGFRCPYAAEKGQVRMLCGAHAQLALAAKRLCKLSEAAYLHFFYKLLDFVHITRPCTGPSCSNLLPPFYAASLHFICSG